MERARLTPTTTKISKKQEAHTVAPQNTPALTLAQHILHLQRTVGNRAVGRLIQAKLAVSHHGDPDEREADRVAEQVTSMPSPESTPTAQRQRMPEEEKNKQPLQTKPLAASMTPLAQRRPCPRKSKRQSRPCRRSRWLQASPHSPSGKDSRGREKRRKTGAAGNPSSSDPPERRAWMQATVLHSSLAKAAAKDVPCLNQCAPIWSLGLGPISRASVSIQTAKHST